MQQAGEYRLNLTPDTVLLKLIYNYAAIDLSVVAVIDLETDVGVALAFENEELELGDLCKL